MESSVGGPSSNLSVIRLPPNLRTRVNDRCNRTNTCLSLVSSTREREALIPPLCIRKFDGVIPALIMRRCDLGGQRECSVSYTEAACACSLSTMLLICSTRKGHELRRYILSIMTTMMLYHRCKPRAWLSLTKKVWLRTWPWWSSPKKMGPSRPGDTCKCIQTYWRLRAELSCITRTSPAKYRYVK